MRSGVRGPRFGLGLLVFSLACSEGTPLPEPSSQLVRAAQGGKLTLSDGSELLIPAGALRADTTVTLSRVEVPEHAELQVTALVLEPEGILLEKPALARLPLPEDWLARSLPLEMEGKGTAPEEAAPFHVELPISGAEGVYFAEAKVHHFSTKVASRNCHAGTVKRVLDAFQARGCDREKLIQDINERFDGLGLSEDSCRSTGPEAVQGLLDGYFSEVGAWNAGEPVPSALLSQLLAAAKSGQKVVLAFGLGPWGPRAGEHGFYSGYAHTATLEVQGDEVVLHNTVMATDGRLRALMGGEVTATWPAARLDEFRQLQTGVALEIALCGTPGCLSAPDLNEHGLDIYHPLGGVDASDPRCGGVCVPPRPVPWPAVRIYLDKTPGDENPCDPSSGEVWLSANLDLPGVMGPFMPTFRFATLAQVTDGQNVILANIPAVSGGIGTVRAPTSFLAVSLHPTESGTGEHNSIGHLEEGAQASVYFFTNEIMERDGSNLPVAFMGVSGRVTVQRFGTSLGDVIKGTFEVDVEGERSTCEVPGCDDPTSEILRGTIDGAFEGKLSVVPE